MKRIGREIKAPLVANMIEGGATPLHPRRNSTTSDSRYPLPLSVLFASTFAAMSVLKELRETGTTRKLKRRMVGFDQFNEMWISQVHGHGARYGSKNKRKSFRNA